MYMAKTTKTGNKGEVFVIKILQWLGHTILKRGKDSKWDILSQKDNITTTYEVKTQPDFFDYGGFSVEIANRWNQYNYMFREDIIWFNGIKCVPTGLLVTQAETHVFTDGKYIAYFVSTKALKEWIKRVNTQEDHRIKFGGNESGSVQVQIRIEEIKQIADYSVGNLPKRGRKPKVASITRTIKSTS